MRLKQFTILFLSILALTQAADKTALQKQYQTTEQKLITRMAMLIESSEVYARKQKNIKTQQLRLVKMIDAHKDIKRISKLKRTDIKQYNQRYNKTNVLLLFQAFSKNCL